MIGLVEEMTEDPGPLIASLLACAPGSIAMLKRGIALAGRGVAADAEQDRRFEDLFGAPALAERLSRRGAARGLPPGRR